MRFTAIQYHAHFKLSSAIFIFRRISGARETKKMRTKTLNGRATVRCMWNHSRSTRTRGSTQAYATSVMRLMTMKRIAPSRTSAFSMERSELFSAFTPS